MKATTLINTASMYRGRSISRADSVATALRQIGILPKGGRGMNAPALTALEVAAFLLTFSSVEKVEDVPQLVSLLQAMVDSDGNRIVPTVAALIEDVAAAYAVRRILVMPNTPMVEIERSDGESQRFFLPDEWVPGFVPSAQGEAFVGQIGLIGGAVFHQIAIDFGSNYDEQVATIVGDA
ncbi:MAG: hypothetical protein KGZ61_08950 [Sandarakinorhabdus sp.]|nr:hypothetical protein [Sandarakinorhabdus sp.]